MPGIFLSVENDKPYAGIGYQAGKFEGSAYINPDGKKAGSAMYTLIDW
jgi:hypothetical protein